MKNRVRLFTVADPGIGLGHLFRCDALAYALHQENISAELVIDCKTGSEWIQGKPLYSSWKLKNWTNNAVYIEKELEDCETPVFDAYSVDSSVWDVVQNYNRDVVVFDDYGEKPFFKGFLINGSPGADIVGYQDLPGRQLLLGPSYQILRPPFWEKTKREIRRKVKSVGIMLGGTDHRGLFPSIVECMRSILPGEVEVYVIGTIQTSPNLKNVISTGFLEAQEIKNLFDSLDILVSAAGQSVAEAVSCVLPVLMLATEKNQIHNYCGWTNYRTSLQGGMFYNSEVIRWDQFKAQLDNLMDYILRRELCSSSSLLQLTRSTKNLCIELLQSFGDICVKNNSISET